MQALAECVVIRRSAIRLAIGLAISVAYSCGGDGAPSAPQVVAPVPVATVDVTPAQQTLSLGATLALSATIRSQSGAVLQGRVVTWASSARTVASVDASGNVAAVGGGTAVITAAAEGKVGYATIVVTVPVASLFIDSIQPRLYVGRTAQLVFQARDVNGRAILGREPSWTSSAPAVVSVSSTGLLTGVAPGIATIAGDIEGQQASRIVVALPIPSAVIALLPEAGTLARGAGYAITPVVTDVDGKPLAGKSVTWSSADPSIATVSSVGVVHPVANGFVIITAIVEGGLQAVSRLIVVDPRTVSGVVGTADGGKPLGLTFSARFGSGVTAQRFIAGVDSVTGAFSLTMPVISGAGPTVEYYVDAGTGATRRYHPAFRSLTSGASPDGARILLIPHTVVPDSGTYAGRALPVDLTEAFIAVCTNTTDANCQSYWPSYWLSGIKTWAEAARPVPLAIDRTTSTVQAVDSVALWSVINNMQADLGRQLYKPVNFTSYTTTGYTTGMVLVSRDSSVAPFAGYTNWNWDATGTLYQAKVRLANASYFANNSLATHELTHALGFSHTCRWLTVMGGYGCGQQTRLGAGDVAYYYLAEMVRRQVLAFKPTWSVSEGLAGARVIEQGLAAANAIPSGLMPMLARLPAPGSDGAP